MQSREQDSPAIERKSPSRRDILRLAAYAGALEFLTSCARSERLPGNPPAPSDLGPSQVPKTEKNEKNEIARYPEHRVMATVFYVGEEATEANGYIDNISTEWESDVTVSFGGIDIPGRQPTDFTPRFNPYYFALPASEFTEKGVILHARESSPWVDEAEKLADDESLFKGRWIAVTNTVGKTIYAQWLDTGPGDDASSATDYAYVFGDGSQKPKNTFGLKAGLDLSPSSAGDLGFGVEEGGEVVSWRFIDADEVPEGPWKDFPAITNKTNW